MLIKQLELKSIFLRMIWFTGTFKTFVNKLFLKSKKKKKKWSAEAMRQDDVKSERRALMFEIRIWMKRSLAPQLQEKKIINKYK